MTFFTTSLKLVYLAQGNTSKNGMEVNVRYLWKKREGKRIKIRRIVYNVREYENVWFIK